MLDTRADVVVEPLTARSFNVDGACVVSRGDTEAVDTLKPPKDRCDPSFCAVGSVVDTAHNRLAPVRGLHTLAEASEPSRERVST